MKEYTTSAGVRIGVQSVPPMLIEEVRLRAQASVEVPPKPTYEVELPDGSMMTYEHDDQSVTTEAEKAAWSKYQAALTRQSQVAATKVMELFFAKGTQVDIQGDWRDIQEYFEVKLPDNPIALKIHYLRTELLTTTDDINGLMGAIMEASGIDRTILEAAKNSFRGQLRQEPDTAVGIGREIQPTQAGGEVVHLAEIPRNRDGEIVGVDPIEMG